MFDEELRLSPQATQPMAVPETTLNWLYSVLTSVRSF